MEIAIISVSIICIMILIYGSTYINMLDKNKIFNLSKSAKVITTELSVTILEFVISGIVVEKYGMPLINNFSHQFSNTTFSLIKYATILILTIVATYITMIIGTYIPKHLALTRKTKKVNIIAIYMFEIVSKLLLPLSFIATILDDSYHKRKDKSEDLLYMKDEIKHFTNVEYHKGSINKTEKEIMEKVATSFKIPVSEIMNPIEKSASVKIKDSFSKIMKKFKDTTYSRLLVYDSNNQTILGALYVKDALNNYENLKTGKIKVESILRHPLVVDDNNTVHRVYMKMKKNKMHLALVKNSKNNIIGMLTLEDILEEILGRIDDEYVH
mgnify:CR=1 FL=1